MVHCNLSAFTVIYIGPHLEPSFSWTSVSNRTVRRRQPSANLNTFTTTSSSLHEAGKAVACRTARLYLSAATSNELRARGNERLLRRELILLNYRTAWGTIARSLVNFPILGATEPALRWLGSTDLRSSGFCKPHRGRTPPVVVCPYPHTSSRLRNGDEQPGTSPTAVSMSPCRLSPHHARMDALPAQSGLVHRCHVIPGRCCLLRHRRCHGRSPSRH